MFGARSGEFRTHPAAPQLPMWHVLLQTPCCELRHRRFSVGMIAKCLLLSFFLPHPVWSFDFVSFWTINPHLGPAAKRVLPLKDSSQPLCCYHEIGWFDIWVLALKLSKLHTSVTSFVVVYQEEWKWSGWQMNDMNTEKGLSIPNSAHIMWKYSGEQMFVIWSHSLWSIDQADRVPYHRSTRLNQSDLQQWRHDPVITRENSGAPPRYLHICDAFHPWTPAWSLDPLKETPQTQAPVSPQTGGEVSHEASVHDVTSCRLLPVKLPRKAINWCKHS